jgi:hypothetical protein
MKIERTHVYIYIKNTKNHFKGIKIILEKNVLYLHLFLLFKIYITLVLFLIINHY